MVGIFHLNKPSEYPLSRVSPTTPHRHYSHIKVLENFMESLLPSRPTSLLVSLSVNVVPVELAAASVNVHVFRPQPSLTLPEEADDPEEYHDRECEIGFEEPLGSTDVLANRGNGSVKL